MIIIIYSSRVFHISISWWFFTGVWVTASLLKSPGLISVFWPSSAMLSPTSKSSRPFNNPLVIVPNAPITIGTIVTFMFHSFFNSLARSRYLSFFSHSFRFILWSAGTAKSIILQILFLLLIIMRSGLLAGIRWSVCMLKSYRSLCESFSRTGAGWCIYHLFVWSNWNFLHSRVSPCTPSVLICCIRLLGDWSFRLCHRIAYIYYFVASYLFSLWYGWFLWRCPVLLLGGIPFLS